MLLKAVPPSPLASRLRLAATIRRLRGEEPAAEFLKRAPGVSRTALTRIETASRKPEHNNVMACLDALRIPEGSEEWLTLMRVCRSSNEPGWWDRSEYRYMTERQKQFANVESGSVWIGWYQNAMLPGPLQTPEFVEGRSTALAQANHSVPNSKAQAKGRLRRQKELLRPGGPDIEAILEEVAIRRCTVDPAIMGQQLKYLLDLLSTLPQLSIRILPVECSFTVGNVPRSPFALHRFEDPEDGMVAFVETVDKDLLLFGQDDAGSDPETGAPPSEVTTYVRLFDRMRDAALSREESTAFISNHAAKLVAGSVP